MLKTYFVKDDNNYKRKKAINGPYIISEFIDEEINSNEDTFFHILTVSVYLMLFYAILYHLANTFLF